ncbi:MAG: hypothetical protein JWR80_4458 [Bradyrhizobium sp.]|nr:hypothetical protein [Bradyrhizobium sp.]
MQIDLDVAFKTVHPKNEPGPLSPQHLVRRQTGDAEPDASVGIFFVFLTDPEGTSCVTTVQLVALA